MNKNNIDDEDLPELNNEARKVPLADEGFYEDGRARDSAVQSTIRRSPRLHSGSGARRD